MKFLKVWIPIPRISPLHTFPVRLLSKWRVIGGIISKSLSDKSRSLGSHLGINGAKLIGFNSNGNAQLRLNTDGVLGLKGTILELPKDDVIYKSVQRAGNWELDECVFLADGLTTSYFLGNTKVAFVDIGANTGLMTLQVMNIAKTNNDCVLFEPIPRHFQALESNLRLEEKVQKYNLALSDVNGETTIFTQSNNHGNSSTIQSAIPKLRRRRGGVITTPIKLIDTKEVCFDLNERYQMLVIKSDTQGMDALILSEFPQEIWGKIQCAIMEVWALPEIREDHVRKLLFNLEKTHVAKWERQEKEINVREIQEFWLSKSGESKNLYLKKRV